MWTQLTSWQKALTVVLAVAGIAAIAAGAVYIALPARSLPHFFPWYSAHANKHATKHGIVVIALGVVLLALTWIVQLSARRSRF
jgi:hypothetical protein